MGNVLITDEDLEAALLEMKSYMDITREDLMKIYEIALKHARERLASRVAVREVMTREVVAIQGEADLQEAARLLVAHQISGLPVVDEENRVIGIITEADVLSLASLKKGRTFKDLIRYLLGEPLPLRRTGNRVKEVMTAPALTTGPDADIREVARIFSAKRIKRLPVVDAAQKLLGIVSRADIIRAMGEK